MNTRDFLTNLIDKYTKKERENLISILNTKFEDHKSNPSIPNLNAISSIGETAFQRAIFNSKMVKLHDADIKIEWIDLEIPITLNKNSRRNCIDLIGKTTEELILVELKYLSSSKSNSPYYGVLELAIYLYLLKENYKNLDKYKVYHQLISMENFCWSNYLDKNKIKMLFVANNDYFNYWIDKDKTELNNLLKEIKDFFDIEYEIYETVNEDFKKQKGNQSKYKPLISSSSWKKVL